MVLHGTLDLSSAPAPELAELPTGPLELPGAHLLHLVFEVTSSELTAVLPRACQPTIPPTVTVAALRCDESPIGPLNLAQVRIGCRTAIWPRSYVLSTVVEDAGAAERLQREWGFACRTGDVEVRRRNDRIDLDVAVDGRAVLAVALTDPQPISGADLWYAPLLSLADVPPGRRLVHTDLQFDAVTRVDRGECAATAFDAAAWGEERLEISYPIAASYAVGDLRLSFLGLFNRPDDVGAEGVERVLEAD